VCPWPHPFDVFFFLDPRIDREALKINEDDTILTISSAGCNALSLLLDDPRHIYLVDRNPCQNALVEMKIAAIKNLEYEDFWKMFGEGTLPLFSKKYYPKLRHDLSPESQKFWDSKAFYFDGTGLKRSFYWRGTCGTISWLISWYTHGAGLNKSFNSILESKSLEEQRAIYFKEVHPKLWNRLVLNLIKSEIYLSWTGVPLPQQKLLSNTVGSTKAIGNWIKDQVEFVFTQLPFNENYFWRLYCEGKYRKQCCPDYLKEENFEKLRASVGKISVYTDTITEFLKKNPEAKISTYILLDHMDWMAEKPELLTEEWNAILKNATKDPKILW
jgi:S-adenosylmethionine-diacylglycerol 3-amino-3-carboxypropyl transferase